MPRYYLSRSEDNGMSMETSKDAFGGGSKAEGVLLGNTNYDDLNNPITSFNFVLEVEALYFLALKSVKGFTKENEFEYIREGGVNDYVHLKRKPISKPFTFQVERYIGTDRFLDPLALGTELILPLALYVYRHKAQQGWSKGAWSDKMPGRIYLFTGCTVMSKEYGELDAERSGLLTETTTIAYRELIAITNPFDNSEKPEWTFSDNKNTDGTYKTKYAAFAKNDNVNSGTYPFKFTNDSNGYRVTVRKEEDTEHKDPWDGSAGSKVKWAKQSGPDQTDATYKVDTEGGIRTVSRKDTSQFNRAQYEMKKDKDKLKYATEAYVDANAKESIYKHTTGDDGIRHTERVDQYNRPQYELKIDSDKAKYAKQSSIDMNPGEKVYDVSTGEDGMRHVKRVDHAQVNKPAWDGSKGADTSWAAKSKPDQANTTYSVETKDGVSTVKRKDSSQFNKPQYEFKKDGRKQLYSEVAFADRAGSIYKVEKDTVTRTDSSDLNRPQYELNKDRDKTKYAKRSPIDDQEAELREQYELSIDEATPKYAAVSPKDAERAEVVTWPPTRRALMADTLKE